MPIARVVAVRERLLHASRERADGRRAAACSDRPRGSDPALRGTPKCCRSSGVSAVRGPRRSASRRTARNAARPIQKPLPSSPRTWPQPPGARAVIASVAAIRDRSRARDDDDARRRGRAGFERDQRVVDDDRARTRADAAHDPGDDDGVFRTIDAGNAETDDGWHDAGRAERLCHHVVENLLDVQLARRLQVGARSRAPPRGALRFRRRDGRPSSCRPHRCRERGSSCDQTCVTRGTQDNGRRSPPAVREREPARELISTRAAGVLHEGGIALTLSAANCYIHKVYAACWKSSQASPGRASPRRCWPSSPSGISPLTHLPSNRQAKRARCGCCEPR